jgi:hypothetical protein
MTAPNLYGELLTKDALASSASVTLKGFMDSPVVIIVAIIAVILFVMWIAEKFVSHKKIK